MAIIPEFKSLQDDIMAKQGQISHAELPAKFLEPAQPCKNGATTGGTTPGSNPTGTDTPGAGTPAPSPGNRKIPKSEQMVKLHLLSKEKLSGLLKDTDKKVSVTMSVGLPQSTFSHQANAPQLPFLDGALSFNADASTSHLLTPKLIISSNNLHR